MRELESYVSTSLSGSDSQTRSTQTAEAALSRHETEELAATRAVPLWGSAVTPPHFKRTRRTRELFHDADYAHVIDDEQLSLEHPISSSGHPNG